jgi:long-chain fatty acid transport protein
MSPTRRASLGTALALVLLAPTARAGGFSVARFGGEAATPTADQPTAVYFNPAALALGHGTRVYLEGLFAWRTASYDRPAGAIDHPLEEGDRSAGTPPDGVAANTGEASLSNLLASPFLGVASDLGVDGLGVGLAFFAPFGGQSRWGEDDDLAGSARFPGAVDGSQRWSTIEGELRELYLSAAAGYRLPGPARISLGASLSFVRQRISTVRARTAEGTDDLVAGDALIEGRSLFDVSGNTFAAGLGVLWQPLDALWIGASYQSQPGFGETRQAGTVTNKFGAEGEATTATELLQTLPDVTRLGLRWLARPDLELRLTFELQRWSVFENQCLVAADVAGARCDLEADGSQGPDAVGVIINIPRHWRDSYGVRGGASYRLAPALELLGGLTFDTAAVPLRYLDPSLMDATKLAATAGVRYGLLADRLALTFTLNNVFYRERELAPRGSSTGFEPPSRVPDNAGTYRLNVLFAGLAAEYRL